ncbi:group II intron reverse transcriptase/maturase [Halanaerobium praevalens]|uniref:RNA-directed DNA polymerase (Reverse transcriptase) n=1 Tax=Halanaerobium praevalens (strain ATCC 33744 / DSM 2228 / GSL) TaxID=572479 RepID=E3DMN9_HALPG|nr:group II intron reverse transcriptase/maturase [Halanaerobium praevalens]ADO76363.1 RNA-directed DNA polymerase (Reverse transcriptase) [Halanaerobium praevalens DSM 2228]
MKEITEKTYYTLKDKVTKIRNMKAAAKHVLDKGGSAGVDRIDTVEFKENYAVHMRELYREFLEDRYQPKPALRVFIPKSDGRQRPLGIPTVKDRIAQAAVRGILEPIYEKEFCDCSLGFRKGKSQIDAINKIEEYKEQGYKWVLDADIKGFFDNINHELLIEFIRQKVTDGWVIEIIKSWLTMGVMKDGEYIPKEKGTPQGGVISPLLANIFLHEFDKIMVERGYKLVRFADDFVVMTKSKRKAKRAYEVVKEIITEKLKLELHPEKTVITNFGEGFVFLGFEFIAWRYKRPRKKSLEKFKDKVRKVTKRNQPWKVDSIIKRLNPKIYGWANYFGHGNVKKLFWRLDKWIRMRLRSYMEKKKAVMNQNKRIPNSFFRKKGLVSLLTRLS